MVLTGGCCCGAIRYESTGAASQPTLCHCPTCRRASGAHSVAWFSVPQAGFQLLQGTPRRYRSSSHVTRTFCGDCGTPLSYQHDDLPSVLDLTLCALDDPEALAPSDQTFCRYRLAWSAGLNSLPALPNSRAEGPG
jgi:hypothetical protein